MVDLLKESIEFWNQRPKVLADFAVRCETGAPCPWCHGDQWVTVEGFGVRICPCYIIKLEAEHAQKYRLISHVEPREKNLNFDGFKKWGNGYWESFQAAIDDMKSLVKSPHEHQWLKLSGVPGCGKSHAVLAAYNLLSYVAIYVHAGLLADRIHKGLDRDGEHPSEWLEINDLKEILVEVPVLFLDDLGEEHSSTFVANTITDIIARRYQSGRSRPTVVTTNLLPSDLCKRYPRLESRLRDSEIVRSHIIGLGDYRGRKDENDKH